MPMHNCVCVWLTSITLWEMNMPSKKKMNIWLNMSIKIENHPNYTPEWPIPPSLEHPKRRPQIIIRTLRVLIYTAVCQSWQCTHTVSTVALPQEGYTVSSANLWASLCSILWVKRPRTWNTWPGSQVVTFSNCSWASLYYDCCEKLN